MTNWQDPCSILQRIHGDLTEGTILTNGTILASIDIDLDDVENSLGIINSSLGGIQGTLSTMSSQLTQLDAIRDELNTLDLMKADLDSMDGKLNTLDAININLDRIYVPAGTLTFLPSAQRTTNLVSNTLNVSEFDYGVVFMDVSAQVDNYDFSASTITAIEQYHDPVGDDWYSLNTFTATTVSTFFHRIQPVYGSELRFNLTLTGCSGSTFTFSVSGIFKAQ